MVTKRFNAFAYRLKRRYGLKEEQYYYMMEAQNGHCLACGEEPPRLLIDHDHKTGSVRGLLCFKCNLLIGFLEQPGNRLAKVLHYLEAF